MRARGAAGRRVRLRAGARQGAGRARPPALPVLAALVLASAAAGAPRTHTVTAGENLYRIALRYGTSVEDVARANGISDASRLRAGARLVIPGGDAPEASEPAASASARSALEETARPPGGEAPERASGGVDAEAPPPTPARHKPVPPPFRKPSPVPAEPPPTRRSWVFGARSVAGPGLRDGLLASRTAGEAPRHQPLVASPRDRTIEFRRPRDGDDVLHEIEIEEGKSVFLNTDYTIRRVSVGDPQVVDVVVLSPRELQLVARKVGGTNVILWAPDGRPQAAIDVHVGSVHSHLESLLRRVLPGEDIRVESAGAGIALRGRVSSAVALDQALSVARAFLGDGDQKLVNLLQLEGNQQVMLKVVVAEMSRSLERQLGSNFATLIETGGKEIAVVSFLEGLAQFNDQGDIAISEAVNLVGSFTGFGSVSLLQVFFSFVERNGLGKILAEPTLVARSGETASFLVGGEVPIPIAQGGAFGSITVEFKNFGVGVGFTPTVLGPDRIHLEVAPEVSEPDFGFGTEVDGTVVPGFITRRASTSVELADGQSFAIAGLLSETVREIAGEYPVLGRIPVLGALFRSSRFQKNETELVIIVTPQLVKPLPPGPHRLPTDTFIEPNAFEYYLLGALEGSGGDETAPLPEESSGLIGDVGWRIPTTPEGGLP